MNIIQNYYHWLHGRWPDRAVEKQPRVNADGIINVKKDTLAASHVQMAEKFTKGAQFIEVKNV